MTTQLEVIDDGAIEPMDKAAAEELNNQIHKACGKLATGAFELLTLLEQAATGQIHAALGFPSWTAWFAENVVIDISNRDERKMIAALMSGRGMSQRVVAKALGVDQKTICNYLRLGEENSSALATMGNDGKTYPRQRRETPRRRPITEPWGYAVDRLTKDAEKLAFLTEDDRFTENRESLGVRRSDLKRAITALQAIVDKFDVVTA